MNAKTAMKAQNTVLISQIMALKKAGIAQKITTYQTKMKNAKSNILTSFYSGKN